MQPYPNDGIFDHFLPIWVLESCQFPIDLESTWLLQDVGQQIVQTLNEWSAYTILHLLFKERTLWSFQLHSLYCKGRFHVSQQSYGLFVSFWFLWHWRGLEHHALRVSLLFDFCCTFKHIKQGSTVCCWWWRGCTWGWGATPRAHSYSTL